ncbi:Haloacid dehalogenase-like hydrolase domain-containing protein 2 [Toxocara canis]|uniref:Haloacid dehalogenase-like hydrolase domain-containing protein 2 n=1 Tax=Toxocara canis TaxID=6265 RepID=A0A0B2VXF5_TOXCA|nr:Haloacid dehalogenase-like hydrolase domain-containing protein 2 [Toxocara canis]
MASSRLAVLIDLSGTLHIEDVCIPGAVAALERLRQNRKYALKFVTNTTKESSSRLHARLSKLGFQISPSEVFTSLSAAKRLILKEQLRPMLFLEDSALEDFRDIDQTDPNSVVIGLAPSCFTFERLNDAFRLLLNGAKLIAIHKGRYYQRKDGLSLGPGPFVEALQFASDAKVEIVGKPERNFFLSALESLDDKLTPSDAVMIGDDARDDAMGAINAGMHAILVKTGKYRVGDEDQIPENSRNCVPSFVEAVDLIEKGHFK